MAVLHIVPLNRALIFRCTPQSKTALLDAMDLYTRRVKLVIHSLIAALLKPLASLPVTNVSRMLLGVAFVCTVGLSEARADFKPELPTLSLEGKGYWGTSKSGLAESIDTGLVYKYGLGVYAGDDKNVSVHIDGLTSATSYSLNNATSSQNELAFLIRYYMGFVYIGAFGGSIQVGAERADGTALDIFASQYGGNLGALITITRGAYLKIDLRYGAPLDIKEASQQTVTLGSKIDAEGSVLFDLTRRSLDLEAGFRYSTFDATFNGAGTGEVLIAPFLGILMSSYF